jgi:hypothetical protein
MSRAGERQNCNSSMGMQDIKEFFLNNIFCLLHMVQAKIQYKKFYYSIL